MFRWDYSFKIRCNGTDFANNKTPGGKCNQHMFWGWSYSFSIYFLNCTLQHSWGELREDGGGEPVMERSWTNVAAVSKSSPCWALLTSWLSQPISHHYYTGDHFFNSILKCGLDVVIQTNKPVTIPQLNGIKRGTYFGRPPVILAKVSKKYAGIMWKMGADIR